MINIESNIARDIGMAKFLFHSLLRCGFCFRKFFSLSLRFQHPLTLTHIRVLVKLSLLNRVLIDRHLFSLNCLVYFK